MPEITTRDGTRLFCRSWGEGPAIVFAHAWAMSSEVWQPQMLKLSQAGFRCIAYDRRGHGRSDDPGRGYDYDTLSDDLAAVVEAFDVYDATFVGHSMGCGEIVRYLSRHGTARAGRVVMQAPSLPYMTRTDDNPDGPGDAAQSAEWRALWSTHFAEWIAPAVAAAYGPDASPDRVRRTVDIMLGCSLQAVISCNEAVTDTDFRAELARLRLPSLVLHGDADQSCPLDATGRKVAALVRGARLRVYPGATHAFVGTHVDQIVGDVLGFIAAGVLEPV